MVTMVGVRGHVKPLTDNNLKGFMKYNKTFKES